MRYKRVKGHEDTGQMGEGHVAKGGDNMTVWEKLLPTFNFSFCADSKPSAAFYPCLLSQVFFSLFFFLPFFPFIQTCQLQHHHHLHLMSPSHKVISCQCHLNTATTAPTLWPLQPLPCHHLWAHQPLPCHPLWAHQPPAAPTLTCVVGTQATPPPSPSLCLVHPKKPQISYFPFFSPLFLMVQDTSPCSTQACCIPHGTQAPTPPSLVCMQAAPLLLPSP